MADNPNPDIGSAPWPLDVPENYDKITLGARKWPGVAEVKIKRGMKIDKKAAKGQDSEIITFQGRKAAEVMIDIIVWDEEEFSEMQDAIADIEPLTGKKDPEPMQIIHPIATMRSVAAVAIEEIDGPDWDREKKWFHIKIKAAEYKKPPPKNTTSTPDSATGDPVTFGSASYGSDPTAVATRQMQGHPVPQDPASKAAAAPYAPPDNTDP